MNKNQKKVLTFLNSQDNGIFHDVRNAFSKNNIPSFKELNKILEDLNDLVDQESIYEHRGLVTLGSENKKELDFILKARINQKGKNYLIDKKEKDRNFIITLVGIIISLISVIITVI